jgi:hypothetical protein
MQFSAGISFQCMCVKLNWPEDKGRAKMRGKLGWVIDGLAVDGLAVDGLAVDGLAVDRLAVGERSRYQT